MKILTKIDVQGVEGFKGGRHSYERSNKGAIMRLSLLLTLLFILLLSFTSYASDDAELIWVAEIGDTSRVKVLLDRGANVDARNMWGNTALILASYKGHVETIKALIDKGANR